MFRWIKKLNIPIKIVIFVAGILASIGFLATAINDGNTFDYAFSERTGWMRLDGTDSTQTYGVTVPETGVGDLDGYAWLENAGWISFAGSCTEAGECPGGITTYTVTATTTDCSVGWSCLSGYAWSEGIGWIRFAAADSTYANNSTSTYGVYIDSAKNFQGYAWSEQVGRISFTGTCGVAEGCPDGLSTYGATFTGGGTPTYTLATTTGKTIHIHGNLIIGDGTNVVIVMASTTNPIFDIDGNITINASTTLIAPTSSPFTIAGDWSNSGTFTHSSGTTTFDGSATSTISGATTFYNLSSVTPSKILEFTAREAGTTTVDFSTCTPDTDCWAWAWDLDADPPTIVGDYNSSVVATSGSYTLISTSNDSWWLLSTPGINDYVSLLSKMRVDQTKASSDISQIDFTGKGHGSAAGIGDIYVCNVNSNTLTLPQCNSWTLAATGTVDTVEDTTITGSIIDNVFNYIDVDGYVYWHYTLHVDFSEIITDYVKMDVVYSVVTTTVEGTLTLDGQDCDTQIKLRSTSLGSYWYLDVLGSASVDYVDVQDSNATGSVSAITATNSTDSENNVNWSITPGVCGVSIITASGTVYTNEGANHIGGGKTVRVKVNGAGDFATTTASDGTYYIDTVGIGSEGDVVTAYLDGETENAVTVTRVASTTANIGGLDLYQNRIITRHEDAGPLTIDDLAYYDYDDDPEDILFTASSTTDTLTASSTAELFVWSGDTFSTGGAGGAISLANVDINGTFTATSTQTITVSENWDATGGNFNSASSTVTFTSTAATTTVTVNDNPFWNLTFNGSGGTWGITDNATTTNNLTVTLGTATGTADFAVLGGDATGNGTLTFTGGTFTLDGTGNFGGTSEWTFYDLNLGDGTGVATTTSTASASTTITNTLTIASNQILKAGANIWHLSGADDTNSPFIINGTFTADTSTFKYTTDQDTRIKATNYYNLHLIDPPMWKLLLAKEAEAQVVEVETQEQKGFFSSLWDSVASFFGKDNKGKKEENVALSELQQKYLQAEKIKSDYKMEKASFIKEAKDENSIQIEVGDKTKDEFKPKLTLRRWDDEVNFDIQLIENEKGTENLELVGDKIKWSKGNIYIEFYDHDEGYKMVWFLKKKSKTNKVEFSIQSKGLNFYYQPPLTEEFENGYNEQFKKEIIVTETQVKDLEGNVLVERTEDVVGSYAVYHNGNPTNWVGGKEYKAGKFGHIYRPHLFDANGLEAWGILHIENGIYSVEIPQDFLDNAVYPIKSNDTFGNTSTGASDGQMENTIQGSYGLTGAEAGTADKITAYVKTTVSHLTKCAIYEYVSSGDAGALIGGTDEVEISNADYDWVDYAFSSPPSLLADTWYFLVSWSNSDTGISYIQYDAVGSKVDVYAPSKVYNGFPDPLTGESGYYVYYSIYATYTAAPSGPTYTLGTDFGQTIIVDGDLVIGNSVDVMSVTGATYNPTLDVAGDVTITGSSTLVAATSSAFTIAGNYTNSGTFTHSNGTTTFDGTAQQTLSGSMIGANAFYGINITNNSGSDPDTSPSLIFSNAASSTSLYVTTDSTKLRFAASTGYTFTNFNLNGQGTGTRVQLRSSTPDTAWKLYVTGTQSVLNTDAKDSDASGGDEIDSTDSSNLNSGGNTNWDFGGAYLSFSLSDNTIGFAPLLAGAVRFATGDGSLSTVDVEAHTLTASTTASDGYTITVRGATLTSGSNIITAIGNTAATSTPGSEQFGIRIIATGGSGVVSAPYNDTTDFAYNATAVTTDVIATTAGISEDTSYSVHYMSNINSNTEAGQYSATLTYIITANF